MLKGKTEEWESQPNVYLQVRHPGERFAPSAEDGWPVLRTVWTDYYLDPDGMRLTTTRPNSDSSLSFEALGDGLTFSNQKLSASTEFTGPLAAKLWVSSSTEDADLFLVLRVFDPDGEEVTVQGAIDPHTPIAQGWLRASHRKLDEDLTETWRP